MSARTRPSYRRATFPLTFWRRSIQARVVISTLLLNFVAESLVSRRTPMLIASLFGGIALFLAAVGIYGVLAFQVAQRRKEIGIRMALGSDGRRIFGLIVSEGLYAGDPAVRPPG